MTTPQVCPGHLPSGPGVGHLGSEDLHHGVLPPDAAQRHPHLLHARLPCICGHVVAGRDNTSPVVVENYIFLLPKVGVAAVANFTVAFVWTIELGTGKWKVGSGIRRSDGITIVTNIDR